MVEMNSETKDGPNELTIEMEQPDDSKTY